MIPNFNPNKWDKEKILDYVIGEQPLTDQQLAFLDYFDKLQKEHNILIEFEKWLEKRIEISSEDDVCISGMYFLSQNHAVYNRCLKKIQELKGDKK